MSHIDRLTAHRELITRHNSMRFESDIARVSLRKDAGRYFVTLADKYYGKTTKKDYATLQGAIVAAEMLQEAYL